jgi:hypothetical protein
LDWRGCISGRPKVPVRREAVVEVEAVEEVLVEGEEGEDDE